MAAFAQAEGNLFLTLRDPYNGESMSKELKVTWLRFSKGVATFPQMPLDVYILEPKPTAQEEKKGG